MTKKHLRRCFEKVTLKRGNRIPLLRDLVNHPSIISLLLMKNLQLCKQWVENVLNRVKKRRDGQQGEHDKDRVMSQFVME